MIRALLLLLLLFLQLALVHGLERPRVVSINVCADQALLDLADPEQILGLSSYARDPSLSWAAERALAFPLISSAEEVVRLAPDLVLAGTFNKSETRSFLAASGLKVETFALTESVEAVKERLRHVGALLGQSERAQRRVDAIERAMERLKRAMLQEPLRVLPLQRRGWVSGEQTLMAELLAHAGLKNVAGELGLTAGGQIGLERLLAVKPDVILGAPEEMLGEDQGSALLLHPALRALIAPERWFFIPGRLTVCGGSALVEAIDLLIASLEKIRALSRS